MSKSIKNRTSVRRRLSRAELLPLSTYYVKKLQLKHHLALTALISADSEKSLGILLNVLYIAFYLRDLTQDVDVTFYRRVEIVLDACIDRMAKGMWRSLEDGERDMISQLLIVHDAQLAATPMHRYTQALDKVSTFAQTDCRSPIPEY